MSFGVTPEGYNLKTLEQINAQIEVALSQVIDPATGEALQADLSDPSDIVSQIIAIVAEGIADGFLVNQVAYNQFDPGKATEDALSSLMVINVPPRKAATFSLVSLDFTGDASTHGNLETGTLGAFANFTPVADGEFAISIDGDPQDVLALNFTGASDYDDVATIVQAGLQAIGTGGFTAATAVASSPTTPATIVITSGTFGNLSSVSVLSPVGGGGGTDVSGASFLNGLAGPIIPGVSNTIPTALQVSNNNRSIIWETTTEFTFDDLGIASDIGAKSAARGAIVAKAGTLTLLINPSDVIASVINPLDAVVGNDQETDNAARRRRDLSTLAPSIGLVGSLDANLKAVKDVTFSRVYNNIDLVPDVNGIPAKTVGCVISGGDDEEIAQVIFERISTGSDTAGTTTVQFTDNIGTIYDIRFFRAIPILVDVKVEVSLAPGTGVFPDDGVEQIKQAIVDYSIGGAAALGITEGFDIVGFPPGQDVLQSRLYTPVNSIAGHIVTFLGLKLTADAPPFLEVNIPIGFDEVSDIQLANIEVVVT